MSRYPRISVEEAEALLTARQHVMLLDMREARAYCQGHDPRAIHLSDLTLRTLLRSTPKHLKLIICCQDGKASPDMARLFGEFGFTHCYSLTGGYDAWQARPQRQQQAQYSRPLKAAVAV